MSTVSGFTVQVSGLFRFWVQTAFLSRTAHGVCLLHCRGLHLETEDLPRGTVPFSRLPRWGDWASRPVRRENRDNPRLMVHARGTVPFSRLSRGGDGANRLVRRENRDSPRLMEAAV